jgi:Fe-S-cluster containining protein
MSDYKNCYDNLPICKGSCCRHGVWVDQEQAKAIQARVLVTPELSDLHGKVLFNPDETEVDVDYHPSGNGIGTALQSPDGPCVFLHPTEYWCRIYQFRPHFCSDYPYVHPVSTSKERVRLDTMFEDDPTCIYHTLMQRDAEDDVPEEKK